jgi:hypothetical protein
MQRGGCGGMTEAMATARGVGEDDVVGTLRPGGAFPMKPRRAEAKAAPSISYDSLAELRERCRKAEREVAELRTANARLRAAGEADRRRAEIAEDCAKRIFALVAQR